MEEIQLPNDIYEIIPSINMWSIFLYLCLGILIAILVYCIIKFISARMKKQEIVVLTKEDKIKNIIQYIENLDSGLENKVFYQKLSFMFRYILELYLNFPATNYTYLELKPHIGSSFFDTNTKTGILSFFSNVDSICFDPAYVTNEENKKIFKDKVLLWSRSIEEKLIEDKKLEEERKNLEKNNYKRGN